jgi:hypothetical protein
VEMRVTQCDRRRRSIQSRVKPLPSSARLLPASAPNHAPPPVRHMAGTLCSPGDTVPEAST